MTHIDALQQLQYDKGADAVIKVAHGYGPGEDIVDARSQRFRASLLGFGRHEERPHVVADFTRGLGDEGTKEKSQVVPRI